MTTRPFGTPRTGGVMGELSPRSASGDAAANWATLVEAFPQPAWLVDARSGKLLAASRGAHALLDAPPGTLVGARADSVLSAPEDLIFWSECSQHWHQDDAVPGRSDVAPALDGTTLHVAPGGRVRHLERSISPLTFDEFGRAHLYLVTVRDITAQRTQTDALESQVEDLRATLESTADGLLVTDLQGRIRAFNRRFAQLWSVPGQLLETRDDERVYAWLRQSVAEPELYDQRLSDIEATPLVRAVDRLNLRCGQVLERVTQPQYRRGEPVGRVWAFRDLTEHVAADRRIQQLSSTDALTGLPNRRQFTERLSRWIGDGSVPGQGAPVSLSLLVLDLDHFKLVNDGLGPKTGDQTLREVARRVRQCLRESDVLARLDGDEFAVLMHGVSPATAEQVAQRVLNAVARPIAHEAGPFTVTCSIGVALYPDDGRSVDDLLSAAETAMTAAKSGGRDTVRLSRPSGGSSLPKATLIQLDHAMRQGLAAGHFRLVYQPQVSMDGRQLLGAEALLRWRDPDYGDRSPVEFIPVAESSGFITNLGDWAMRSAVAQAVRWRDQGLWVPVAVNVSALQFQQADFVERVRALLAQAGLPGSLLKLELTESILLLDAEDTLKRLSALEALDVKLSVDDFGTGYSSLAYLKRVPVEALKIDRSFVSGLPHEAGDVAIVQAIMHMAQALKLHVVAEGVETEAQRQFLASLGCYSMQGFLYAPPLEPPEFERQVMPLEPPPVAPASRQG